MRVCVCVYIYTYACVCICLYICGGCIITVFVVVSVEINRNHCFVLERIESSVYRTERRNKSGSDEWKLGDCNFDLRQQATRGIIISTDCIISWSILPCVDHTGSISVENWNCDWQVCGHGSFSHVGFVVAIILFCFVFHSLFFVISFVCFLLLLRLFFVLFCFRFLFSFLLFVCFCFLRWVFFVLLGFCFCFCFVFFCCWK